MLSAASRTTLQRLFPVEYCPESIKTTLHKIFSCAVLSAASWTTLHKVFTCAMLYQKYYDNIEKNFSVQYCLDNIAQGFYLCSIVPRELRQHWTGFFPVQYWPVVNRQLFWVKQPIECCVYQAGTTLHMNIVYSMLSKYVWDNIAQEYWFNIAPDHIVIYSLENNYM